LLHPFQSKKLYNAATMQGFSSSACVHGSTQSQFCGIARSLRNCTLSSPSQLRSRQSLSVEGMISLATFHCCNALLPKHAVGDASVANGDRMQSFSFVWRPAMMKLFAVERSSKAVHAHRQKGEQRIQRDVLTHSQQDAARGKLAGKESVLARASATGHS
jgi:hypothetical protein